MSDVYYDPYDYEIDRNPHPIWKRLRDEAPLYHNEKLDFYALSRFSDVMNASLDEKTFLSGQGTVLELIGKIPQPPPMIFQDPPDHTRLRKLVSRAFSPRRISELEPRIRDLCAMYLDPLVGRSGFDYVAEFGAKLPVMVISSLLGIPEQDQDRVRELTDAVLHREEGSTEVGKAATKASAELFGYFHECAEKRRLEPADDMLTDLAQSEMVLDDGSTRPLDPLELMTFVGLISAAGNETVARLLGWTGVLFARHPDEREKLVKDPALIKGAVEELLRYEAPSPIQARVTARDVEIHGQLVPKGAKVGLLTGSAGRDDREYPDADRFDIARKIDRHVSLGFGVHFCLGASLARLESRVAIEETLARFPEWRLDEDAVEMVHTSTVRGPAKVPIEL